MSGERKFMEDVDLDERSVTFTPATHRMSLVAKSGERPMSESLKEHTKAELSEAAAAGIGAAMAELDKVKGELGEYYDKIVQAISEVLGGPTEPGEPEADPAMAEAGEAALAELDQEEPAVGAAAEILANVLGKTRKIKHADELPPHLQRVLDAERRKSEEQGKKIKALEREGEIRKTVTMLKADLGDVPMDPETLAEILHEMPAEARKSVEEMLGKVNGVVGKALAGEIGTSAADDGSSASAKIRKHAEEIKRKALEDKGERMPDAQARVQARRLHPDLAAEERAER